MFEKAIRLKLRFNTPRGQISCEDLWDLPLLGRGSQLDLNTVAKTASAELRSLSEEDFVSTSVPSAQREAAELKLNIAKYVIAIKKAEAETAKQSAVIASRKRLIEDILAKKQVQGLESKSEEELKALLSTM